VQGSERQRATSAPEPRGQPLAIGCRPEQGSLPPRVGNKVSVFRSLLAAEAEQGRARKDPLASAVFENPTGFRVEEPWGPEVAVRLPADPTPGAQKNATIFAAAHAGGNRGVCWGSWGRDCRRPPGAAFSATRTRRNRGVCVLRGLRDADRPPRAAAAAEKRPVFLRRARSLPRTWSRSSPGKFPTRAARPSPLCETCGGSPLSGHRVFLTHRLRSEMYPPGSGEADRLHPPPLRKPGGAQAERLTGVYIGRGGHDADHLPGSAQRLASTIARMPARTAGGRLDQAPTT